MPIVAQAASRVGQAILPTAEDVRSFFAWVVECGGLPARHGFNEGGTPLCGRRGLTSAVRNLAHRWHARFARRLLPQRRKRNGKMLISEWDDILARV